MEELLRGGMPDKMSLEGLEGEAVSLAEAVNQIIEHNAEIRDFILPLSQGELSKNIPRTRNFLASPFKELHSKLMHLTWQAEQVARGDFNQRVEFMGDFSKAFNSMVESLDRSETQLKDKISQLEQLNRIKNEFLGMAAHDLRSPLAVLEMYSSFLMERAKGCLPERDMEFLEIIHNRVEFMLRLIDDLLDVSRIESGHLDLEPVPGDYLEFVRHNVSLNGVIAGRKEVLVTVEPGEGSLVIPFDAGKMEQVLNNLISNAVKFPQPGTRVQVTVSEEDGRVVTSVSDEGPGIPPEELPLIFKEFHKGTVKPTGGESSTGLGLAITRRIVDGHGGEIRAESVVGKGSVFSFTLPRET